MPLQQQKLSQIANTLGSVVFAFAIAAAATQPVSAAGGPQRIDLADRWELQSTAALSRGFWYPATVPSTVVSTLVDNQVLPDPYCGMNLRSFPGVDYAVGEDFAVMPMDAGSPYAISWWYRNRFQLPTEFPAGRVWLHFDSINSGANIWLNGRKIADAADVRGMYRVFEFDVTDAISRDGLNLLAVEVLPPQETDLTNTFVDWHPMPPDKGMGLTGPVYITSSGPVTVRNTQVLSRISANLDKAQLTLLTELRNTTGDPVTGSLVGSIGSLSVSRSVRLDPGTTQRVAFTAADYPQLSISNPALWWPNEMGPQTLNSLHMEFQAAGATSDAQDVTFGIREYTSELDGQQNRVFRVNGKRVFVRGGGWTRDMLLRVDDEREEGQLRYMRDMHLNAIRLEGQMMSDHFFETADRLGLMVITGWACCSYWEEWDRWTDSDYAIAAASLRDQVRRLRNHASALAFLYSSYFAPPVRAEQAYLSVFNEENWTQPVLSAATDRETLANGKTGLKVPGPYEFVPPNYWYLDKDTGGAWGFVTESTPGAAIPVRETIDQMLAAGDRWPMNDTWDFHTAGGRWHGLDIITDAVQNRYGMAANLDDFVRKNQMTAYEGERAMFEAFRRNKFTAATGVIHWLANNGWPSMVWHLFDYYSRPGGGYFGTKKANEPLHVQYSYDDNSVVVVNALPTAYAKYSVTARVYNFDLSQRFTQSATLDVPADGMIKAFTIPQIDGLTRTYFIRLTLADEKGALVSSNFYWLSTQNDVIDLRASRDRGVPLATYADLSDLQKLPMVNLRVQWDGSQDGDNEVDTVTVTNPSDNLAFGVRLTVRKGAGGGDVQPVYWEDNYFELLPGETRRVSATYAKKLLEGIAPAIQVDGWNVTVN